VPGFRVDARRGEPGGAVGRTAFGRETVTTLDVGENTVETLDMLVRSGDTVAALQILEPLLFEPI
jgi:hypothetical protein